VVLVALSEEWSACFSLVRCNCTPWNVQSWDLWEFVRITQFLYRTARTKKNATELPKKAPKKTPKIKGRRDPFGVITQPVAPSGKSRFSTKRGWKKRRSRVETSNSPSISSKTPEFLFRNCTFPTQPPQSGNTPHTVPLTQHNQHNTTNTENLPPSTARQRSATM